jgi:hypothetical protein
LEAHVLHRSSLNRRLAAVVGALIALAVAAVPAAADTFHFRAGTFAGTSSLDAGKIELKVVRKSSGLFVRHIVVKGSFDCYGYPEDVDVDRYVSGVKVGPRGGFTIPDADVSLRGHYVTSARIEGSLIAKTLSCDSPRKHFGAHL